MIHALDQYPALTEDLAALSRIGDRRWDLIFYSGLRVQLPENGVAQALAQLDHVPDGRPAARSRRHRHRHARAGHGVAEARRCSPTKAWADDKKKNKHVTKGDAEYETAAERAAGEQTAMMTDMMTARLKPVQPGRATLVSVLDIGSTKICCVIARLTPRPEGKALQGPHPHRRGHRLRLRRVGRHQERRHHRSRPGRAGDPHRRRHGRARRWAHGRSRWSSTSPPAGSARRRSRRPSIWAAQEVEKADIQRVLRAVNERSVRPERSIVHALPIGYAHRRPEGRQGSARPGRREALGRCRGDQRRDARDAQHRAGAQPLPSADRSADGDALRLGPVDAGRRRGAARRRRSSISAARRRPSRCLPTAIRSIATPSPSAAIT